ncbi:hypothetical protein C8Q79DRAFT_950961 [Trametes meyenii]|nr:hypothetical protein C8Q79DRAFT_950961 [Trametes meyenii]
MRMLYLRIYRSVCDLEVRLKLIPITTLKSKEGVARIPSYHRHTHHRHPLKVASLCVSHIPTVCR